MFFRHQKDSGSWSIYNTENLFDVNWILATFRFQFLQHPRLSGDLQKFDPIPRIIFLNQKEGKKTELNAKFNNPTFNNNVETI